MDDVERGRALLEEAEALDRQLVNYVVDKLAASRLAGDNTLSADVVQQIEAVFATAAQAQGAAIGAAIAERCQGLIEVLDSHRAALAGEIAATDDGPPKTASRRASIMGAARPDMDDHDIPPVTQESIQAEGSAGADNSDYPDGQGGRKVGQGGGRKIAWLMPFGAGAVMTGALAAAAYFALILQPDTPDACDLVVDMRYELNQMAADLDTLAATDEFKAVVPDADAPAAAQRPASPVPVGTPSLLQTLASKVADTRGRLRKLVGRQPQTCPFGR